MPPKKAASQTAAKPKANAPKKNTAPVKKEKEAEKKVADIKPEVIENNILNEQEEPKIENLEIKKVEEDRQ